MSTTKKYLVGMFDDDHTLLLAVDAANESGHKIHDVYSPFPLDGLPEKLGLTNTKIPTAGFIFGLTGLIFAFSLMAFASSVNYPTNFGGKPVFAFPAWIPIMFEFTVLFSGIGMVSSFYYLCNLYPGKQPKIIDARLTDHMFAITIDITKDDSKVSEYTDLFKGKGALEVFEKEI